MVRWGAALLVWVACDAGVGTEQPHKATRADFDKDLGTPLPLHGFAVRTFGRFDYLDLELIDLDAETMRVIADGSSVHVDQTLALAGSDLKSLDDLSDCRNRRAGQHRGGRQAGKHGFHRRWLRRDRLVL